LPFSPSFSAIRFLADPQPSAEEDRLDTEVEFNIAVLAHTDVTLGIGYSWGSGRLPGVDRVVTDGGQAGVPIVDVDALLKYRRWKIIIGFAFGTGAAKSDS
jgi:hypothetical protein